MEAKTKESFMSAERFREIMRVLGLSRKQTAIMLHRGEETVRAYQRDITNIPESIAIFMENKLSAASDEVLRSVHPDERVPATKRKIVSLMRGRKKSEDGSVGSVNEKEEDVAKKKTGERAVQSVRDILSQSFPKSQFEVLWESKKGGRIRIDCLTPVNFSLVQSLISSRANVARLSVTPFRQKVGGAKAARKAAIKSGEKEKTVHVKATRLTPSETCKEVFDALIDDCALDPDARWFMVPVSKEMFDDIRDCEKRVFVIKDQGFQIEDYVVFTDVSGNIVLDEAFIIGDVIRNTDSKGIALSWAVIDVDPVDD